VTSRVFTDQLSKKIEITFPPQRIVSLVPSQTELLFYLGLSNQIVGVTKFCIHPEKECATKTKIGGTKNFRFDVIDALKPDLIISNKEENYQEGVEQLQSKYPVWMSDISNLSEALNMITGIGQVTNTETRANLLVEQIKRSFQKLKKHSSLKVVYLIWKSPWMAAGKNTFIDDMLAKLGLINAVDSNRYPIISEDELQELRPDLIMLSSEPFPFKERHIQELQMLLPTTKIMLVDGEIFSWYGNRMLKAVDYFNSLEL
jgi:ABC-type Fe3+-hydroxamate transport system substrate-binding protein